MAKKTTTQEFVPVEDIRDGIVILKNGQLCGILLASSINFALKSSSEQEAILSQFQSFLNTLDFSIQIYVQSRRLDIKPYLEQLQAREADQYNDLMRVQLREYMEFIRTFTSEVEIMTKSFFVVIPYTPLNMNVRSNIQNMFSKGGGKQTLSRERFDEYRAQIEQRISVVEQGLNRIGVKTIALTTEELVELFYHVFNPEETTPAPKQ